MGVTDYQYSQTTGGFYDPYAYQSSGVVVSHQGEEPSKIITEEMLTTCAACAMDCEWILCDTCKLALVELRDKILTAIAKTIEDDLS